MTSESSDSLVAAARVYRAAKEAYNATFDVYDRFLKRKDLRTWKTADWQEHILRVAELRKVEDVLRAAERALHDAAMKS